MTLIVIIFIVVHIVSGVILYGLCFGDFYLIDKEYLDYCPPTAHHEKTFAFLVSMFGVFGLILALLLKVLVGSHICIKYSNRDLVKTYKESMRSKFDYETNFI